MKPLIANKITTDIKESMFKASLFFLSLYFYFLGLQKILALGYFRFWLLHAPVTKIFPTLLSLLIPAMQLVMAAFLLLKWTRTVALYTIVIMQLSYVAWITYIVHATPYLVWPWRPLLFQTNWFYLLAQALTVAWLALLCGNMNKTGKNKIRLF